MRSASAAASTVASRGRSWRPSTPTPWWVLKVTSRTGIGGWSGPGAGRVPRGSLTNPPRWRSSAPFAGAAVPMVRSQARSSASACHLRRDGVRQRQVGDQLQPFVAGVVPVGDEQPEGDVAVVEDELTELVAEV